MYRVVITGGPVHLVLSMFLTVILQYLMSRALVSNMIERQLRQNRSRVLPTRRQAVQVCHVDGQRRAVEESLSTTAQASLPAL